MVVPDTNGILVGSRVLMRGIEIGHVTGIAQVVEGVEVAWDYDADVQIPESSIFRLDNLSALGESYVAVMPDGKAGPFLSEGQRVDQRRVLVPTTFKELSQRLTVLLRQVDPTKVRRIVGEVDAGLPDGAEVLTSISRAGSLLAGELTEQSDAFVTLLSTLQPLIMSTGNVPAQLAATTPLVPRFGREFNVTLEAIADVTVLRCGHREGNRRGGGAGGRRTPGVPGRQREGPEHHRRQPAARGTCRCRIAERSRHQPRARQLPGGDPGQGRSHSHRAHGRALMV
ncbi:MlaD family protein [Gordonia amicalis]|uniref:MlaD family protein n=1 Tax=Gordonia amicalis TaxID=89053 RepID=UPI0029549AAE|nr:MlaD family protein [Gordonia amicalis]MDV7099764.1 MlaD family protein [Gordonia amicalis]